MDFETINRLISGVLFAVMAGTAASTVVLYALYKRREQRARRPLGAKAPIAVPQTVLAADAAPTRRAVRFG